MAELPGLGDGRMGMAGFDVVDRDQGQAQVARFLEQAMERGLVGYGPWMMVVPSLPRVMVSPSNQAAHRESRCPLRRISYRPGLCWWPSGVLFMGRTLGADV